MTTKKPKAPTDLELMQLADGELDEPRRAEIEAYWEAHPESAARARALGASLGVVGLAVRRSAEERSATVDLADDVLAAIAREEAGAVAEQPKGDAAAPHGKVVPLRPRTVPARRDDARKREQDASRNLMALVAIGIAAAAGITIWGRTGDPTSGGLASGQVESARAAQLPTEQTVRPIEVVASNPTQSPDVDDEPGVSLGALEFGAGHSGNVFQILGDGDNGATTILWTREDDR